MTQDTAQDFFISYNKADRTWAEWIAWQLERAGYTTIIQAWDFRAGSNFVLEMQQAASTARRTLAVLSPDYLTALYTQPEWAAAFVQDPTGRAHTLLPVRVRPCELSGLLSAIVYLNLVDLDEPEAATALLAEARGTRAKPMTSPTFPGRTPPPRVAPRFPGTLPPIWTIPFRQNPFFTGRDALLTRLHEQLTTTQATALTQPQAINGLGGIGKTQAAIEYAYRYRDEYQAVLWVSAETPLSLLTDVGKLATALNLPERDAQDQEVLVAAVKHWLLTHAEWLLILDNTDDLQVAADFLPIGSAGHILLTTRAQALGTLAKSLPVEEMASDEGTLLLLRRAGVLETTAPLESAAASDRTPAEAIVEAVGGLPLALDQAGAYIEETGCTLADYLQLYQARRHDLLGLRKSLLAEHPEPVTTTWSLSFQKLDETNHAATALLAVCAFLAADSIAEEILTEGAPHLGEVLQPVAADPLTFNQTIEEVRRYSLLKRQAATKALSMHRLVQAVLRDQMPREEQRQWAERAIRVVNQVFPTPALEAWARCARYLPHVQVCAEQLNQYQLAFPEAAHLLHDTAIYLQDHARYAEADKYLQQALHIYQQVLPTDYPNTAATLHALGLLKALQARYAEAEQYYQQALHIKQQVLPADHPDTANTLHEIGVLKRQQGQYVEAEQYYQQALHIEQQALPADHPNTVITRQNYASLLRQMGRENEARALETHLKTR